MDYTKKIIRQSNYWYNDGLKKARIRDMSGAIVSLRRSLQYNKGNKEKYGGDTGSYTGSKSL
jgi:hypothetical protein